MVDYETVIILKRVRNKNMIYLFDELASYLKGKSALLYQSFDKNVRIKNLKKVQKIKPDLYDVYFGFGLYDVTAGSFPDIVKIITRILFIPSGDYQRGIEELKIAHEKGFLTKTISCYALAYSYFYYEQNYGRY